MSQRRIAAVLASVLLVGLLVTPALVHLPYVRYQPGPTLDVLGQEEGSDGGRIIEVSGQEVHQDGGELRMTTVYVSPPNGGIDLYTALDAWLDPQEGVHPYSSVYPEDQSEEDSDLESEVQMISSQDTAVAAALTELGYDVSAVTEVQSVSAGMPADGTLQVRDELLQVGDTEITRPTDVVEAVRGAEAGQPLDVRIRRGDVERTVTLTPRENDGRPMIGIVPGVGYDFPFDVSLNVDPDIGGPSAGLMFALGIYDVLTEGSLTGGADVAGTGTIDAEGRVGAIGGIQQKIAAAGEEGAELFLVPADNCVDAVAAPAGDMRLARADTFAGALEVLESWRADPDAALPGCEQEARG